MARMVCFVAITLAWFYAGAEDGKSGGGGGFGRDGRPGSVVIARGCSEFLSQTVMSMHDSFTAGTWLETMSFMCGDKPEISSAELAALNRALNLKISHLVASGFVDSKKSKIPKGSLANSLEDLNMKVAALNEIFQHLEKNPRRHYGCVIGSYVSTGRAAEPLKVCFQSEIKHVEGDGTIDAKMTVEGYGVSDTWTDRHYIFSEQAYIGKAPVLCDNGVPAFDSQLKRTSGALEVVNTVKSTCEKFSSVYSSVYPPIEVTFR